MGNPEGHVAAHYRTPTLENSSVALPNLVLSRYRKLTAPPTDGGNFLWTLPIHIHSIAPSQQRPPPLVTPSVTWDDCTRYSFHEQTAPLTGVTGKHHLRSLVKLCRSTSPLIYMGHYLVCVCVCGGGGGRGGGGLDMGFPIACSWGWKSAKGKRYWGTLQCVSCETTIVDRIVGTIGPSPSLLPPNSMLRYRAIGPVRQPNFGGAGEGAASYRRPTCLVVSENDRLNL